MYSDKQIHVDMETIVYFDIYLKLSLYTCLFTAKSLHMFIYSFFSFCFIIVTCNTFHTYINFKLCLQTIHISSLLQAYQSLFFIPQTIF